MPSVMIFIQFLQDPTGPHVNLLREAGLEVRFPPRPDLTDEEGNRPGAAGDLGDHRRGRALQAGG